jgi:glycosyltransferase involved in cell wall biosynthesis
VHPVKVSVVIPLYNARDVIADTIKSVLAQTWTDYEIIVVDDGSQDGSGELVQAFGDRVRYVGQDNMGVAGARNRGIAESQGTYVALLDHDDLWHPTKLTKQVGILERQLNVGMVVTDVAQLNREGRPTGAVMPGYYPCDTFARLFVKGYVPTPSASLIRRSIFSVIGGFDEDFKSAGLDDHELWTRIAVEAEIVSIPEPLTYHRMRYIKSAEIALGHRSILISKLLQRFQHDPEKRRYLLREQASYFADLGKYLVMEGQVQRGRSCLIKGLMLSMGHPRSFKTLWRCFSRVLRSYVK